MRSATNRMNHRFFTRARLVGALGLCESNSQNVFAKSAAETPGNTTVPSAALMANARYVLWVAGGISKEAIERSLQAGDIPGVTIERRRKNGGGRMRERVIGQPDDGRS